MTGRFVGGDDEAGAWLRAFGTASPATRMAADAEGREHKGKGTGGGQFVKKGAGGVDSGGDKGKEPKGEEPAATPRGEPNPGSRVDGLLRDATAVRWGRGAPAQLGLPDSSVSSTFTTSGGQTYAVVATPDRIKDGPEKADGVEVSFFDPSGSTEVTGAGNAHEVFSRAVTATLSLLKSGGHDYIGFTAKEPSRQKLYDRLARTAVAAMPGYQAVAMTGYKGVRQYYIFKPEKAEIVKAGAKGLTQFAAAVGEGPLMPATGTEIETWVGPGGWAAGQQDSTFTADPPRPGLVPQSGDPAHPKHWVRPEDAAGGKPTPQSPTGPSPAPAGDAPPPDLSDLAAQFPAEAADPHAWGNATTTLGKVHEAVTGWFARNQFRVHDLIAGGLEAAFDTPADMQKFGYNPAASAGTASSTVAAQADPVYAHLGISSHLAVSIASKVLAAGLTWAKGRLTGTHADGGAVAATLADLFAAVNDAVGYPLLTTDAGRIAAGLAG